MKQLIESIKRLYNSQKINKETVIKLYENKKITEQEKEYILDVKHL